MCIRDSSHIRQGSVISRVSNYNVGSPHEGNPNEHSALSRRCSRHSHHSKRSSLGSTNNNQQQQGPVTTQADVMLTQQASPGHSPRGVGVGPGGQPVTADIERRLSQLSDNEVEAVVAKAMEEVSRRNSGSQSFHHRRVSPQMSLTCLLYTSPSPRDS